MRPAVLTIAAAGTAALLCACTAPSVTSSPVSGASGATNVPTSLSPTVVGGQTFSAVPSDPPSRPASATASTTASAPSAPRSPTDSAATTASAAGPSASTCTRVTVRVIEGGATPGSELAALQFVNAGARACRLTGFPAVTLTRSGRVVGTASQPASAAASTVRLAAGQTAQSLLHDYSSCSAPLSDSARITLPGSTSVVTHPLQLRACTLRVDPLTRQ